MSVVPEKTNKEQSTCNDEGREKKYTPSLSFPLYILILIHVQFPDHATRLCLWCFPRATLPQRHQWETQPVGAGRQADAGRCKQARKLASNPILGPTPDHMCHPKDFLACLLYSAVQDFVACRSNLFVCVDSW
jgi:hypothetical protein